MAPVPAQGRARPRPGGPAGLRTPPSSADELFERLYAGEVEKLSERERHPKLAEWAEQVHAACEAHPDFARLSDEVRGDAVASAIATQKLLDEVKPHLPEAVVPPEPLLRRSLARGCERASSAVEEYRDASEGLHGVGFGTGAGDNVRTDGTAYRQLASRLRQDERLKRIALLAGRFKRIAAAKRRQRVRHGADEVSDIEQGGDFARLLPVELAKLARPAMRLALLRDVSDKQAMQYRLSGHTPLGRGPLVVCVDKSGSMDGERDIWATAVALALLEVAHAERRPFALLPFDAGVRAVYSVNPGEQLPQEALFIQAHGGTDVSNVVRRGLELIEKEPEKLRKADLVLITDGESDTSDAAAFKAKAEALGVTMLGVGIGVSAGSLEPWCHDVHVISSRLDTLDDSTAELLFAH